VRSGRVTVVAAIGATQTLAWASSYYMPAILGAPIAADLGLPPSVFFGVFSAALLLSAVVGPAVGRLIDRHGGRDILASSNLVLGAGLIARWRFRRGCSGSASPGEFSASGSAWAFTIRHSPL
jgi:hypothetical protein